MEGEREGGERGRERYEITQFWRDEPKAEYMSSLSDLVYA